MRRKRKIEDGERSVPDRERSRQRTMNRAVKLLAAKPRSEGELRERLLEKPWTDREIVENVIRKLGEYKYVDDESFARQSAISQLRQKPQGERRLRFTMSRKKLSPENIDAAIAAAFEQMPESELIETAIAKRIRLKGRPESREELKKFYDHLLRQGFGFDLIREKLSRIGEISDE